MKKSSELRQPKLDNGITYLRVENLPPETQAMLNTIKPLPRKEQYSTLAPQSRRHSQCISERGKYQQSGGEGW